MQPTQKAARLYLQRYGQHLPLEEKTFSDILFYNSLIS